MARPEGNGKSQKKRKTPGHGDRKNTKCEQRCNYENADLKGNVTRFFDSGFSIKQLVPLYTSRKDFEFFRIFEELFVFVIDSPLYSQPGSRDSSFYS
jgi:hypothetical protein